MGVLGEWLLEDWRDVREGSDGIGGLDRPFFCFTSTVFCSCLLDMMYKLNQLSPENYMSSLLCPLGNFGLGTQRLTRMVS